MKKLVASFSGDYRVMRVCFANSNPLEVFNDLHNTISYKTFIKFLEYLDAKTTLDIEANEAARKKAQHQQEEQQRRENRGY